MKPAPPCGCRLLSQHLRVGTVPAGSRLLDPHDVVWRKSNPMRISRPALHQCARDPDLGGARSRRQGLYSITKRSRPARRRAGALGLDHCALPTARSGSRAATARSCTRRRSQALLARVILSSSRPTTSCSIPSAAPARPARSPSASAPLRRRRRDASYAAAAEKRIAAIEPLAPRRSPNSYARDAPRVPFAALIERGLVTPARTCATPAQGQCAGARRRRHLAG